MKYITIVLRPASDLKKMSKLEETGRDDFESVDLLSRPRSPYMRKLEHRSSPSITHAVREFYEVVLPMLCS